MPLPQISELSEPSPEPFTLCVFSCDNLVTDYILKVHCSMPNLAQLSDEDVNVKTPPVKDCFACLDIKQNWMCHEKSGGNESYMWQEKAEVWHAAAWKESESTYTCLPPSEALEEMGNSSCSLVAFRVSMCLYVLGLFERCCY